MARPQGVPREYIRRIVDDELDELLSSLPAVSIDGAKGVGKTTTALERGGTSFELDRPEILELVRADPKRLTTAVAPIIVDEWQREPSVWDVVRRAVDTDSSPNRFILTGSASPDSATTHSGAGRIVPIRMRPLTLPERGVAVPTVSLAELCSGERSPVSGTTQVSLETYVDEIVASGFPAIRRAEGRARRALLDGYLDLVIERDVEEAGYRTRNPAALRRWLTAYAAATSTTASLETIRDAATSGQGEKPAKSTTIPYRDVLERIWMLDSVPAWLPTMSQLRRLNEASKHHLADPALAARLVGASSKSLLTGGFISPVIPRDGTFLGALFESLVALSIRVFAQSCEARVFHLRTKAGEREVDFIVEIPDGRIVALEVKLALTVDSNDVRHLNWLAEELGDRLLDAAIITAGPDAYRRPDGIAVIPAALLGP
jgi:predicted AAA+ superfamily ATPase